jgi:curved DNA-binding protein CbpA
VTDYFALLGEPRQPWLDEEELKSKFFALSSSVHPDRAHVLPEKEKRSAHERYTELNAAYNCLREPKERLRHLIELQTGRKPVQVQEVPGEMVEIFFQIGQACREADEFLKRKAAVTSPILLVEFFEQGQSLTECLMKLSRALAERQSQLIAELKMVNAEWSEKIERLEQIQQTLSYLHRWIAQLQERIVQLAS